MFSGIVEALGRVARIQRKGNDLHLSLAVGSEFAERLETGNSVMVSGVCLTVTALEADSFASDISTETLSRTTIGGWGESRRVNLERALCLGDSINGHFVSGHVDAIGRVAAREPEAGSERFSISAPAPLAPLIAPKGSICVDGVSLTVNGVNDNPVPSTPGGAEFSVNIIPYTLECTALSLLHPGDTVNLEADLIARYVERRLSC